MPASDSFIDQRDSSPKAGAQYRGRNTVVAEIGGSGRQSRKRGKNGVQKESNAAKEADPITASELGGSPPPATIERVAETAPRPFPTRNDFAPSAVLDALNSAEQVADSHGSNFTGAWAQSMPISKSPSDVSKGMGPVISPPTVATAVERGGFSSKTPPSSPPMRRSRPVSSNAGISPPQPRQVLPRRSSRILLQPFSAASPPPPHLPQPHFYGVPDIDIGLGGRLRDAKSDESSRFVSFAELDLARSRRPKSRSDVVLLAVEDRLDVITLQKDKLAALGTLKGVGGTIVDAKILTWESGLDPFLHARPLVSLVVHGPRRQGNSGPLSASALALDQDSNTTSANAEAVLSLRANECTDFQTTVEIYSLANQEHLATILCSQSAPGLPNLRGLPVSVPPPVGSLKLDARGNFLTVSSGTSGEVFVFAVDGNSSANFRCIGKLWTSVQTLHDRRYSNSSNSTDTDASPADMDRGGKFAQSPILSLSSRWLAIVPPGPTACQSLHLTVTPGSIPMTTPGLESRNAPPRPPVSCALESPDAESFINRVARGVAQEVVKGARWIGGQGLQTWNNYWNRDQYMNVQGPAPNRNIYQVDPHLPAGIFPPTHAPETRPNSADPQLVSIIDLQMLAREPYTSGSDAVIPLATFQPPNGVSFLSFSPDGLAVVSATKKGDIQYVWDLKQIRHLRASTLQTYHDSETSARAGKVTQVARYARLTPSSIVDIVWKCPSGDRFAVITKNGTIHIFDLPLSAFQWPPIRRSLRLEPSSAPASPAVTAQPDESTIVAGVFSSALKLAGKTQPMLANLRGRAPSIGISNAVASGNTSIGFASATGIRGSKVVAAGLSRSVGAATGTVNSLRHVGDNRLHLGALAKNPVRSHVCWSHRREQSILLVIDGESIKSFHVSRRRSSSKPRRQALSAIDANPRLRLSLPSLEQLLTHEDTARPALNHGSGDGEEIAAGYWASRPSLRNMEPSQIIDPLSCAEIETNAPYQPFHSDRRVSLFVYNDSNAGTSFTNVHEPWVFGNDIATTRLDIRPPTVSDEEEQNVGASVLYRHTSTTSGERGGNDEAMAEQVVVTTRRRKNRTPHQSMLAAGTKSEHDDGFFEDDCDVLDFAEDRV